VNLDVVAKSVIGLILSFDNESVLSGVYHAEDPDQVPSQVPVCTFAFVPAPYSKIFDEFYMEWTFWFNNPFFSNVSDIVNRIEENSDEWVDCVQDGKVLGRVWFLLNRSPQTGGRNNLKYITLFIKVRATFNEIC
jgi:hypothetical protein